MWPIQEESYDEWGDVVDHTLSFEGVGVEEVTDYDGGHDYEDLCDSYVEVPDHVELWEGMLGVGSDLLD